MGYIPPVKIVDESAGVDKTTGWIWLGPDTVGGYSFHVEDGGNTGAIKIHVSNDPRCFNASSTATVDSVEITSDLTITDPGGSSSDQMINVSNVRHQYVQYEWDNASGTDAHVVYFAATSN